jgi:hypothetical protein
MREEERRYRRQHERNVFIVYHCHNRDYDSRSGSSSGAHQPGGCRREVEHARGPNEWRHDFNEFRVDGNRNYIGVVAQVSRSRGGPGDDYGLWRQHHHVSWPLPELSAERCDGDDERRLPPSEWKPGRYEYGALQGEDSGFCPRFDHDGYSRQVGGSRVQTQRTSVSELRDAAQQGSSRWGYERRWNPEQRIL